MAKAKYKRGSDGCFQARVWDGTYTEDGKKRELHSDPGNQAGTWKIWLKEMEQKVQERKYVRQTDICIQDYATKWLSVYKAGKEKNTIAMYKNIIDKHLDVLK